MSERNENKVYIIPPDFIQSGTLFGGLVKFRNALEAAVLAFLAGFPVLKLHIGLTAKIIILCLTALPLGVLGLIGINGESLSSFIFGFLKFLKNRRVLKIGGDRKTSVSEYLPIEKIENGIIYTKDKRYIKIIEVLPINFLLRSAREQRSIIYSFVSYLKISPVKMQFKIITKKADTKKHRDIVLKEMEKETDESCRRLQRDYLKLINRIGSKEATTRRFFIAFEYENGGRRVKNDESEAVAALQTAARTAVNYLKQCGNKVIIPDNEDEFTADILYGIICRDESFKKPLAEKVAETAARYIAEGKSTDNVPVAEFLSPESTDLTHGRYIKTGALYRAYYIIPSGGYKTQVPAGWLSLLINAGDGIDTDLFLFRQPKEQAVRRLGQQLRINRSKIREASDTNTDFDDLDSAISSGYFLKEGLANNEDFYYMSILITVTAYTPEELEWPGTGIKENAYFAGYKHIRLHIPRRSGFSFVTAAGIS